MNRLSVVDEIFLRTHRGMGTPIALQGLWRTADRVRPELLAEVHAALRDGPLGRRVVRSRVPGARPCWRATRSAHPLRIAERPIPAAELLNWADGQGFDLDPEFGPGWRLAAAPLDDGGSVISLTCSHALADGRGLTIAIDHALSGTAASEDPAPQSDWGDARKQWATVLGGTARALRHGVPARPAVPDTRAPVTAERATCGAVLQIPAADWDLVGAGHGGTANSLFVHLTAKMLWDSGFPGETLTASVPVDTRAEPRVDNDMAMTEVVVTRADTPATLREKCRAAYEHRMSAPAGMPEELLQVLPTRLAHRLSRGAGERDILCSNIGPLPPSLAHLGPHTCTGVAARAIHPGLLPTHLPRTHLSAYLSRTPHTYTLALISLTPDHLPTRQSLTDLASTTLNTLDLPHTAW
ncbi:hypothetical protein BJY24_003467 [Nocardia transvalensis]|uniref:Condensation domain-containing protein n=1 Tax=Nocardia transvalensis TaxID=37333 RepID=A0A7W9PEK0_9NOCA|nr:hypothetical protein [Nocardia transvalensis]MBB5914600.1 hypothetical protein [Nocardia transvalensis]